MAETLTKDDIQRDITKEGKLLIVSDDVYALTLAINNLANKIERLAQK